MSHMAQKAVAWGVAIAGLGIFLPAAAEAGVRLPIDFHRQEHSLSCEIAALKMALGVHGIEKPEAILMKHLPFDRTPKASGVWGDPNQGFVGNINGRMLVTGYGVYWDPIAKIGDLYTETKVIRHGSAREVARHLSAGDPVIAWGYYGRPAVYSWTTPEGKSVRAVNGEHTRVVYGFDGSPENPTHFHLMDPLTGSLTWTTDEFMHNWSGLQHMAVVVKHPPTSQK